MNAHTPFDANQDWTNPYCQNSSNDPMVDALLGNAYHVVRTVYCNLGNLKLIYDFLNQYGMVLGVQSEAELKALTTKASFARIYDKTPAGDRRVTDYLYVEGDRTGIPPDDITATGSWVKVATSGSSGGGGESTNDGGYIPWIYNSGSAIGGETTIRIPDEAAGAPFMIVNGDWQTEGYDFEYDPVAFEVSFTTPLEPGDFVVVMRTGVPATPDNPNVSDWVTINWLYNQGAAVGGEQVIDIPYTFQSVPAVYKNGLRFYKGLTNNSYTIDSDNNRIILTEPLATNDRLIVQLGGEAKILEIADHTIQEVARAANVKDSEVILSTDTTQVLNGKKVLYDVVTQRIHGLPTLPTNVYINTVSNGQLTYSPGNITVTLLDSYQQRNTRELWRRSLAEAGLTLVDGSFEEGATANSKTDAVWHIAGGQCYTWYEELPKDVPANSTPASTGGVSNSAWMPVGDITLRTDLASTSTGKGSSLVAYKGALADEVNTTLKVFADPTYLLSRWGAVGDGVTDDSEAIQKAINAMPDVGTLIFDKPSYVVSNVTISKGVTLLGSDFSQSGVHLINNHATNPTFKALSINNIKIDGFYFDSSVTRVSSATGYLDFTTCHRVTVQNSFFWEYFLAVSFDGGTEINFDTCEGFTTKSGTGSGFAWFGKNNYTGSINIVNCYLKVDDSTGAVMPEFGVRFGYVDVAYIDGSTTIIRHGHDVEVVPNGAGQFAHLIKIVGGILDTAKAGIYVQPVNGADAEVELVGCYSATHSGAAWVFDGTNGKVTASITAGQIFNCGVSALDVLGANAVVYCRGLAFSNNQIDIHVTNGATAFVEEPVSGTAYGGAGSQYNYSIDATAKGHIRNPVFKNAFNAGVNLSSTFDVCDLWLDYAPTITSVGGTIGPVTVASSRYKITNKSLEFEIAMTISAATSSGGIVVSLPRPPRTHLVGIGRNVTAGPMLQCAADPTNTNMLVVKYDNTHPVVAAGNVLVARTIYEIN